MGISEDIDQFVKATKDAQNAEQRRICRAIIAGLMMHSITLDPRSEGTLPECVKWSVEAADALLAELNRTEPK